MKQLKITNEQFREAVEKYYITDICLISGRIKLYTGVDDMNCIVCKSTSFNRYELRTELNNILYIVQDGVYTFLDYNTHKYYALHYGISSGYRRKPKEGVQTKYKSTERYGYGNGNRTPEQMKNVYKEKFKMLERYKKGYPALYTCGKCNKDNYRI